MKTYIKAWIIANLLGGLLISPLVIHHTLTSSGAGPLEEETSASVVDNSAWEEYKNSAWY